jgi:transcriptional regulator with XRE-family HTH domain
METGDWEAARAHLGAWMLAHGQNQNQLARQAGLNRSIIHRFLEKGQPLSSESASKIYRVVSVHAGLVERDEWLQQLHLSEVAFTLGRPPADEDIYLASPVASRSGRYAEDLQEGFRLLNLSLSAGMNLRASLPLLERAEQVFGHASSMAAIAAANQVQALIDLGDLTRARYEVNRINKAYDGIMDPLTRSRFFLVWGQLEYTYHNYMQSMRVFNELARIEVETETVFMAQHWLGVSYMGLSDITKNPVEAQRYLALAEHHMLTSLQERLLKYPIAEGVGFEHLRMAQIQRRCGQIEKAQYHLEQAYLSYNGETTRLHVELELADMALEKGDTQIARCKAKYCLESWSTLWAGVGYPSGMARSLVVIALSLVAEQAPRAALPPAIVAAALAPYEHYDKSERVNQLPCIIMGDLRRQMDASAFARMVHELLDDVKAHRGYFIYMTHATPDCTPQALCLLQDYL